MKTKGHWHRLMGSIVVETSPYMSIIGTVLKVKKYLGKKSQDFALETMRFDLMDDGTIAVQKNHHLIIGTEESEGKFMLVG